MQGQLGQLDFYGQTCCHSYEESIFFVPNPVYVLGLIFFTAYWIACQNKLIPRSVMTNNWNSFKQKSLLLRLFFYSHLYVYEYVGCIQLTVLFVNVHHYMIFKNKKEVGQFDHITKSGRMPILSTCAVWKTQSVRPEVWGKLCELNLHLLLLLFLSKNGWVGSCLSLKPLQEKVT